MDWTITTWKGSRRRQHQEFYALPFSRKLEVLEEMNHSARATVDRLRKSGLPYIDPCTGERVRGTAVREDPPAPPS